jgi:hypothetical protein
VSMGSLPGLSRLSRNQARAKAKNRSDIINRSFKEDAGVISLAAFAFADGREPAVRSLGLCP